MATDLIDRPLTRQISMNAIARTILGRGPTSRAELARLTGLSKQTVSEVVRGLEAAGWLREGAVLEGGLGRRAVAYEIDAAAALTVAVDLGGTKVHVAIGDLLGAVVAERLEPTDPGGGAHVLAQIARLAAELCVEAGCPAGRLHLAVLGTPGVFHPDTGHVSISPNIRDLDRIDVRGALAQRLGVPVLVENDVNLAASGEAWQGCGRGVGTFVFVAIGTGIGMGIVAGGRLFRGATGAAGEIGYMAQGGDPYDPRSFAAGTLEGAVGSVAIARRYAGYGGPPGTTVSEIFARLGAGDAAAEAAVEETARLLAPAIASIGAVLDPEMVVLGGSIGARPELLQAVGRFLPRCAACPPPVATSALGSRATLIGALGVGAERLHDRLFGVAPLRGQGEAEA